MGTRCSIAVVALLAVRALGACSDDEPPIDPTTPEIASAPAPVPPEAAEASTPPGPRPQCGVGADIELEDNGTPATATPVTALKFCGVLESPTDVDYFTFTTPPGTKLTVFQAVVTAPMDITVSINGMTYLPGDPALATSGTFVAKFAAKDMKTASYQTRVQYDPN